MLVNKYFQIWPLIGWQDSHQPIRNHVRKSYLTNMDFTWKLHSNPGRRLQSVEASSVIHSPNWNALLYYAKHYDVIKWKHFPRYWPFVRGIYRSPVNSPHKGQWRGTLMFSLICAWINGWVNNREAGDLRSYRAHYDVTVISKIFVPSVHNSQQLQTYRNTRQLSVTSSIRRKPIVARVSCSSVIEWERPIS